ncbi:unnamed protein product [Candidula unifasciata]|uniref:BZIP domain-containing protein n=1 Tax=Candidula unifasciata TaxID=100452 RepID=A0A8S3ZGF6_9EUPU|nr:unnamed protein product [Candidula unifasciata]
MDSDLFSSPAALDLTMKSTIVSCPVKSETTSPDMFLTMADTTAAFSITRQPTIIVTTTSTPLVTAKSSIFGSDTISIPTVHIKQEPVECLDQIHEQAVNLESIVLPPTPPGSSGSDSEGSQSPLNSAPSSPIRQSSLRHSSSGTQVAGKGYTQPLFVNAISQSGLLILSEEEKRTLISEGYPIPSKLPLTKQEEKNLKKIRRKIKNKISAQESRRKKKEYLEALEKRIEAYNHENNDLKKKVENLESNNRSLLGQLQKLQSLVSKMPKAATATQTGTALMVLVFCFAVFLGSMSPSNLNIGYSTKPPMLGFVQPQTISLPQPQPQMGPQPLPALDTSSPYVTPNMKSRVLMSVDQEDNCDDLRPMPWENSMLCPIVESIANKNMEMPNPGVNLLGGANIPSGGQTTADAMVVMVVAASVETNGSDSRDSAANGYQNQVVPDIEMIHQEMFNHGRLHNMSVEMETA